MLGVLPSSNAVTLAFIVISSSCLFQMIADAQHPHHCRPTHALLCDADEPERVHWYSRTQFADMWRWLTEKNPFFVTSECPQQGRGHAVQLVLVSV